MCRQKCRNMIFQLASYFVALHIIAGTTASHWNYQDEGNWPPKCKNGKHQSPIALYRSIAKTVDFTPFTLNGYGEEVTAVLKNNGHSAEVRLNSEQIPEIMGGGLSHIYQLDHLHFHWKSEHEIDDYRFPLELHLVHYAKPYRNITNALKHPQGVAVLAVLFDYSPDDDEEFEPLLRIIETVTNKINQPTPLTDFVVKHFLPRNLAGYYRYDGSLTTPTCDEAVIWTLFTDTIPISQDQVEIFEKMHADDNSILKQNYRSLQPLNDRTIYLRVSPIRSDASINKVPVIVLFFALYYVSTY